MNKKKIIIVCIMVLVFIPIIILCFNFIPSKNVVGVWWWDNTLNTEKYLTFAKQNNVNEIYYCSSEFGAETSTFIREANKMGIEVYYLQGEYKWLDDSSKLFEKIESYRKYQEEYPNNAFAGIHLDIEPHQNPDFDSKRESLILKLIELSSLLKITYPEISFDYDIPFWFNDNITFNNKTCPAYEHMIDIANRVFVMSYRDSSDAIIEVASEELVYAKTLGKQLILSVQCSGTEGDFVSFAEEGKQVMAKELQKLKQQLGETVGISIHHIKSWYDMKE